MKLTLEPTAKIDHINGQPHRVWTGTTDQGVPVHAWIAAVSPQTHDPEANALFDRELKALPQPRQLVTIDYRMIAD